MRIGAIDIARIVAPKGGAYLLRGLYPVYPTPTTQLTNVAVGTQAAHTPNSVIEVVGNFKDGHSGYFRFRRTDAANGWHVYWNGSGYVLFMQLVASVETQRGASLNIASNAVERMTIVANGNNYKLYWNDVLKLDYTDAGSFNVNATIMRDDAQAGWVCTNLDAWRLYP